MEEGRRAQRWRRPDAAALEMGRRYGNTLTPLSKTPFSLAANALCDVAKESHSADGGGELSRTFR